MDIKIFSAKWRTPQTEDFEQQDVRQNKLTEHWESWKLTAKAITIDPWEIYPKRKPANFENRSHESCSQEGL